MYCLNGLSARVEMEKFVDLKRVGLRVRSVVLESTSWRCAIGR